MEVFMLIRKNVPEYIYPYYILMDSISNIDKSLCEFQDDYPECEVVLRLKVQDSEKLFERLKDEDWIVWCGGHVYPEVSESELIDRIMYIFDTTPEE